MRATLFAIVLLAALGAHAERKTICTITVNSADEKEALRARLPRGDYEFVELVQKGRRDWLAASCRRGVACDALVVSGHFNAGETFYSDRPGVDEHLEIDELERAACSGSCPGLFARLKEVYLFGCESLNPDASKYSSAYGESGRSRMRRIFAGVPVIYGFSSAAPVGPTAAMLLHRYFDAGGARIGSGRVSAQLLKAFSRNSMTTVRGEPAAGPEAEQRARICTFFDTRLAPAERLAAVHRILGAAPGEAATLVPRLEKLFAGVDAAARGEPAFTRALAALRDDAALREHFLAATRAAAPAPGARRIALAATIGWLDAPARRTEELRLVDALLARGSVGFAEVGLACELNRDGTLAAERHRLRPRAAAPTSVGHAAVLACLGDPDAHTRTLEALASGRDAEVQVAQAYLRHRPPGDAGELRALAAGIARMPPTPAKVRALDALARLRISDREIIDGLARAFAESRSAPVQRAIAGVLIRSDDRRPELARVIRDHRLEPPGRGGLVDALANQLPAS